MVIHTYSIEELNENFHSLFNKIWEDKLKQLQSLTSKEQLDFLTKIQTRQYLGGISQPTLDKLVKDGKITAYQSSEGRIVFYRPELTQYVLNNKKTLTNQ